MFVWNPEDQDEVELSINSTNWNATMWIHTPKNPMFRKHSSLHVSDPAVFNQRKRFLEEARFLRISNSSFNLYRPSFRVSRRKDVSITFVRQSASCAALCTHRKSTPSEMRSLIALALSWVLYSAQLGVAVRVMRS